MCVDVLISFYVSFQGLVFFLLLFSRYISHMVTVGM